MKYTPEKDALEKRIREMAEPLEIPPSLAPENLMSRLPDRQQTPIIRIRRYLPAAAAAACLLLVLSGTVFLREFSADPMITAESPVTNSSTDSAGDTESSAKEESSSAGSSEVSAESVPENSEPDLSSETPVSADTGSTSTAPQSSGSHSQTTTTPDSQESASQLPEEFSTPSSEPEGNLQQQDISAYQSVFETMMAFRQSDAIYENGGISTASSSHVSVTMDGEGVGAQPVQKNDQVLCTLSSDIEADMVNIYSVSDGSAIPAASFQPEYTLPEFEGMHCSSISFTGLYLEEDTLGIIGTAYYWSDTGSRQQEVTLLVTYDLSNPQKPEYCSTLAQDGKLTASYQQDGRLALVTTYMVPPQQELSEDQISTYIPVCYIDGEEILPSHEQIQISQEADAPTYTFISLINLNRPDKFQDIFSYLGQGDSFYLTEGQIYMARSGTSKTRLTAFSYTGSRIRMDAETVLDGVMMENFSANPNGRSLRVSVATSQNSVTLYLLDKKLEILGKMENFIPADTVSSVWYHEYFAYYLDANGQFLCTVDCSMPKSLEFLDEMPTDMGDFGEYYEFGSNILKITPAYGENGTQTGLELILYQDRSPYGFEELCSTSLEGSVNLLGWGEEENLFLDSRNGLIGIPVVEYGEEVQIRYVLFSYKKSTGFVKLLDIPLESNSQYLDYRTGFYDDGTFWLATPDEVLTFSVQELKKNAAQ